jgi:2-dehydro-3-deoxygalactonokinase
LPAPTVLIGVDWGTSNLRALRIADGGEVQAERADPRGAGGLDPADFAAVLADLAGDWLEEGPPVLVCGMAGARGRWREAPYCPCPASLDEVANALVQPEPGRDIWIVPGVAVMDETGLRDVMRGEETQILGLFGEGESGLAVTPGTHSKWATVEDGRLTGFRTFMTGDLFAAVRRDTILGQDMGEPGVDGAAFRRGVVRGLADRALTAALFSVRVETLGGRLEPRGAADYLSGLLIGAEIAAQPHRDRPVVLVGAEALAGRYATALDLAGFARVERADASVAVARGLWRIWRARR